MPLLLAEAKRGQPHFLLPGNEITSVARLTMHVSCIVQASATTFSKEVSHAAQGHSVSFEGSASDLPSGYGPGDLVWLWDFGDGNTSTSQSPCHPYSAGGVKNVKLTVKTSNGCFQDDDTCTVHVVSSVIIDMVDGRPSTKIAFNNNNGVKGHAYPSSLPSCCSVHIDWEMNDIARADCSIADNPGGGLYGIPLAWTANWPTSWSASDALVACIGKWASESDDLDTSGFVQGSIALDKFFDRHGDENPGTGDPPNWFYYWSKTSAGYGSVVYEGTYRYGYCDPSPPYTAHVCERDHEAFSVRSPGDNAGNTLEGIDSFAWTCRHETRHSEKMNEWHVYGHNVPLLIDDDYPLADWIPDILEDWMASEEGGPFDCQYTDTYLSDQTSNDFERYTQMTQEPWVQWGAYTEDWAYPGQQWHP